MLPPKTTLKRDFIFPSDVFWITPDGVAIEVIGHLTGIQASPETFGLHDAPQTHKQISQAIHGLLSEGWVRGRYDAGTFSFQMERPRGTSIGAAHEMVLKFRDHASRVVVDFTGPYPFKDFEAADFINQKFPMSWGLNPRRRVRR